MQTLTVMITGASSGIGAALAREFAERGARLVLVARRTDRLVALASELRAGGSEVLVCAGDVTRDGDLERATEQAQKTFGVLDVVVANAGFGVQGRLARLSIDDVRRQFETNVFGVLRTFYATHAALAESRGRLALIGSVSGFFCSPGTIPYSMSKFAVRALAEGLQYELAREGISVTHIAPGFVESEISLVDNQGVLHDTPPRPKAPQFLFMKTPEAARQIVDAILAREPLRIITGHGKVLVAASRYTPDMLRTTLKLLAGRVAKLSIE